MLMFIRQISPRLFNSTKVNAESQIFLYIKKIRLKIWLKILRQRFLQLQSIEQFNMRENNKVSTHCKLKSEITKNYPIKWKMTIC